jgi:hypothetical protein
MGLFVSSVFCSCVSRDHNRVVSRPPATPRGRVRRWSAACRPAPSFRDSAADYPANHRILLVGGSRWRRQRPSVPAVKQGAGLVPRVKREAAAGAAGRVGLQPTGLDPWGRACRSAELIGAAPMRGLDMPNSYCQSSGQARGRQSRFPGRSEGNPPVDAEPRVYTLVFGGLEQTGP